MLEGNEKADPSCHTQYSFCHAFVHELHMLLYLLDRAGSLVAVVLLKEKGAALFTNSKHTHSVGYEHTQCCWEFSGWLGRCMFLKIAPKDNFLVTLSLRPSAKLDMEIYNGKPVEEVALKEGILTARVLNACLRMSKFTMQQVHASRAQKIHSGESSHSWVKPKVAVCQ